MLDPVIWSIWAWVGISPECFLNCWRHTGYFEVSVKQFCWSRKRKSTATYGTHRAAGEDRHSIVEGRNLGQAMVYQKKLLHWEDFDENLTGGKSLDLIDEILTHVTIHAIRPSGHLGNQHSGRWDRRRNTRGSDRDLRRKKTYTELSDGSQHNSALEPELLNTYTP